MKQRWRLWSRVKWSRVGNSTTKKNRVNEIYRKQSCVSFKSSQSVGRLFHVKFPMSQSLPPLPALKVILFKSIFWNALTASRRAGVVVIVIVNETKPTFFQTNNINSAFDSRDVEMFFPLSVINVWVALFEEVPRNSTFRLFRIFSFFFLFVRY